MLPPDLDAFFQQHAQYYRTCDATGIMNHYHDASLFWEACGSNLKGRDEIHGWFSIMFNRWDVESIELELVAHRVKGDMACCVCFWKLRCCEEGAEEGMRSVLLRATYCLEKIDEKWKIWHVHGSV